MPTGDEPEYATQRTCPDGMTEGFGAECATQEVFGAECSAGADAHGGRDRGAPAVSGAASGHGVHPTPSILRPENSTLHPKI
jgi:hypothetical protein